MLLFRPSVEKIAAKEQNLCDHPSLSVSFLKRHGLLDPDRGGALSWSFGQGSDRYELMAEWTPADRTLRIINRAWGDPLGAFKILHYENQGIHRTYIIDPKTDKRCNRLYCVGETFGSRLAFGVPFPSTVLSPWAKGRFEAQHPGQAIVWPKPHDPVLDEPPVLDPSPQPPLAPKVVYREWSTRHALAPRRRDGGVRPEMQASLDEIIAEARRKGRPPRRRQPWPADRFMWGAYELTPRIALDDLRAAGLVQAGERRYARLWYDHDRADLQETRICVDLTDAASPVMGLISRSRRTQSDADERHQVIWFSLPEATPQRRRYLICPFSGRLVNKLAYRQGVWASPWALRLMAQSQFDRFELKAMRDAKADWRSIRKARRRRL